MPYYTASTLPSLPSHARLGVVGNPIAHSKSPQMQQAALDALGLPYTYIRMQAGLEEGGFQHLLRQLGDLGFIGLNVTVPFKKQAYALSVQADTLATLCGSVNTLIRRADGWHGFNTDGPGFEQAILELGGAPLSRRRVVLLGACGGAGSALAAQCALAGCPELILVNRPKPALEELARKLAPHSTGSVAACALGSPELRQALRRADLLINATSLGLRREDPLPLPGEWLHDSLTVYDIVTHDTPLRQQARQKGCRTSNGLGMLLWQGAYAFRHWFGQLPPIEPMRLALQA